MKAGSLAERYRNLSLRAKFAFHFAVSVALLFAVLVPGVVYLQRRAVLDEARQRGLQLTKVFAHASVQAVVADDFLVLRQIINSIASEPDVLHAMILDPTGRLLAHSDVQETGRTYSDPLTQRAAATERPLVQEVWRRDLDAYDVAVPIYVLNERRGIARIGFSLAAQQATIRRTRNLMLGVALLALAAFLALAVWQARTVARPIAGLLQGAQEIAAGNLDREIPVMGRDEVGQLAAAFNRMGESLKARGEIDREISSTLDLDAVLRTIAHYALLLLKTDIAHVASRDPRTGIATVVAGAGERADSFHGLEILPGRGAGGYVLATGRPLMIADYARDPRITHEYDEPVQREGVVSTLVVPITLKGTTIGLLYVANRRPTTFTSQDQEILMRLASQAAIAIDNATLYAQVRRHAEELEDQVEARTRELQEANRRLEAASRHKSAFLANMSHELRTPLNAIIGFTRLVMRRAKDALPDRQHENLEKILISADHLLTLINGILDLSKIEAGRVDVQPLNVDLEELIDVCLRTLEPMVRSERLRLVKEIASDLPPVSTDRHKLQQILMNLLSNAVKFTEAGTITVTARRRDGQVAIAVADTGVGIPGDALELIFEEFRQVDGSTTRRYGGTGLGLSISRHLARLLGGDITVESTVGVGSTFTVIMPLRYEAPRAAPGTAAARSAEDRPAGPGTGKVVLAIDDDPDVVYLLRENLADAGYHVIGALNAEDGLQKARELRPFAITLDMFMPHRDGWATLRDLKADPTTAHIPVIVVSIVDNKELGFRLGAFDYLLKPFDREAILSALGRIPPHHGRLLVVDDDPQVADLVRQMLEGEPYEVATAADGQEALEAIARQRPDVILLDLLMPRMDGLAVIEHLHQDPRDRLIPVLVLTAKALTATEHAALEQSVLKVIHKMGLDRGTLVRELRRALEAYRDAGARE